MKLYIILYDEYELPPDKYEKYPFLLKNKLQLGTITGKERLILIKNRWINVDAQNIEEKIWEGLVEQDGFSIKSGILYCFVYGHDMEWCSLKGYELLDHIISDFPPFLTKFRKIPYWLCWYLTERPPKFGNYWDSDCVFNYF